MPPDDDIIIKRPKGFQPGHPRYGGRKKGSIMRRTANAQRVAEELGFDPVRWLAKIAVDGVMQNADGTETVVDPEMRLDAGKAVMPYITPKLLPVSQATDARAPVTEIDIEKMMENPALVEAAQTLSLAANNAPMLPAPEIPLDTDEGSEDDYHNL